MNRDKNTKITKKFYNLGVKLVFKDKQMTYENKVYFLSYLSAYL